MLLLYLQEYDDAARSSLESLCRDSFDLDWDTRVEGLAATPTALLEKVRSANPPALFIMEDDRRDELDAAVAEIRGQNALHYLVLRLSQLEDAILLRPPYYRASGFLLAPVEKSTLRRLLAGVYQDWSAAQGEYGGFFPLKIRGTLYQIPYSKILFFESAGKKIVARTAAQEYEFYDSLEEISRTAPDFFLRVHRSFCVNIQQVSAVNFSEHSITMRDDSIVSFSRTYRQEVEQAMGKLKTDHIF
jgi:DNA-binding LytR/AlgR family response regulator